MKALIESLVAIALGIFLGIAVGILFKYGFAVVALVLTVITVAGTLVFDNRVRK